LIEGKLGILDLLDEECRLPSGSDSSLIAKLYKQFATPPSTNAYFAKPRFSQSAFTVVHYAHSVVYDADGFLDKNRDTMPEEILNLLQSSSFDFCSELFQKSTPDESAEDTKPAYGAPAKFGAAKRGGLHKPTLGSSFKISLQNLMTTIRSTNVHYIRCIKPNEQKVAFSFDPVYVLHQLRACGVLETIRISCAGYPSRLGFNEFNERYKMLVHSSQRTDGKEMCLKILKTVVEDEDKFQVGLSKVFLRAGQVKSAFKVVVVVLNCSWRMLKRNGKIESLGLSC
jgi:myosin-5